ncbi:Ser/Thr protein kinase RdoA involved in Cpx stress response, MazF antagonist [Micromonospora citrea]|uniref:Ser/Thr protein kinase RdoA involved in Cpx stress response, MazF antagonist n=1 Tax=Micromonospora citrea TaxID=47855 RepID=A0A1C6UHY6_9ACTN|nr:aminoglycoside phosphotransferase family protein [Micromonospora citrea]SCL53558.1 Ser/Thr protein kinase RdoA involved in Cpx stress response, MazF antagonist [Micromonospora citrea]
MSGTGRFGDEAMTAAMRQVADQLGVRADNAQLLQLTNNAVFALPSERIVIRIARSHRLRDRVRKVVELGRWFAQIDAPTIRLAEGITQPVQAGELMASVWDYLPQNPPAPTVEDLGVVLRRFHAVGPPPFPLPAWDPVGDARLRISEAEGLSDEDREFLLSWCERLEGPVAVLRQRAEGQLIHGDAHVGNLLRDRCGRLVLCDFDATCKGPWQIDLTAVAVGGVRFGRAEAHASMAAAYGYDIATDRYWPTLREARELKMIAAAAPIVDTSPSIRAEFTKRLQSIRRRETSAAWTPFIRAQRLRDRLDHLIMPLKHSSH